MATDSIQLTVNGMTCNNCARSVERKLTSLPGVSKVSVDLGNAKAAVEYDSAMVKPDTIASAVRSLGYEVPA